MQYIFFRINGIPANSIKKILDLFYTVLYNTYTYVEVCHYTLYFVGSLCERRL